jgi:hypothetical protein
MNCDLAFDCLTDPARRQCAELTEHLTRCPRCRDMAEALEPAIDLLSEVSSTETVSADAASFDNAGSLGEPAATSLEPRRQSSPLDGRLTAPVKSPGDPARPTAPWHTESHRRLQRRLVTWQLLAGIAGVRSAVAGRSAGACRMSASHDNRGIGIDRCRRLCRLPHTRRVSAADRRIKTRTGADGTDALRRVPRFATSARDRLRRSNEPGGKWPANTARLRVSADRRLNTPPGNSFNPQATAP